MVVKMNVVADRRGGQRVAGGGWKQGVGVQGLVCLTLSWFHVHFFFFFFFFTVLCAALQKAGVLWSRRNLVFSV